MENIELKENEIMVSPTGKFSYQITPLTDKILIIDKDILKQIKPINGTKCFDLENNCVIDYDNTEDLERERIEKLRRLREPLLVAFDKYKTNVVYGLVIETPEEKELIIKWYKSILDLNEAALNDVPEKIKYYL